MEERKKKLMESINKFNKSQKGKVVDFGNTIEEYGVIPTGVEKFDEFIGGGLKRGAHTILWGGYSVGKTAMALTTIASAQKQGLTCCYVNVEKPIDPIRFEFFGINLEEMLYIEAPNDAEQALEALRAFSKDKVIDLFIIDSIQGLCPKSVKEHKGKERGLDQTNVASLPRTLSNFYAVVNSDVFRSKAAVLWIGQTRVGGIGTFFVRAQLSGGKAQEFYAYQMIFMRTGQTADAPIVPVKEYYTDPTGKERFKTVKKPIGFDCVFRMDKTNSSKSKLKNDTLHIPYFNASGFHAPVEEIEKAEKLNVDDQNNDRLTIKNPKNSAKLTDTEDPKKPKKRGRKKKEVKNDE